MAAKFIRVPAVLERYGVSQTTLYSLVRKGELPAPRRLGACSVWSVAELDEFDARLTAGVDSRRVAVASAKRRKPSVAAV